MPASNELVDLCSLSPQPLIGTVNSPHSVTQLINIPSCASDFLLPESKSDTQCETLPHQMLLHEMIIIAHDTACISKVQVQLHPQLQVQL